MTYGRTETVGRPPARCPQHGDHGAVRTAVRESGPLRLRQHRCAEGCGTPLGWDFSDAGKGAFQHGPGQCDDPAVDTAFRIRRNDEMSAPLLALAIMAGMVTAGILLAGVVMALCSNATGGWEYVGKGMAITVPVGAAGLLGYREVRRRRPAGETVT